MTAVLAEAPVVGPPAPGPRRPPAWERPALAGLLALTAVLYLWGLGASGWANAYYSAATQAAATSWKALFFGSSDAANFITVDKTPAAVWVMGLSARLFGVNAWSILVPEALMGVGSVALVCASVRRWFTPGAGLLAGAVTALTPAAALMFRFNTPDALLVLLLTGSAYAMTRAVESGRTAWVVAAGSLVGFGFLAKMLQALLVVPALGLVYLVAGPPKLGRRLAQLAAGGLALLVSGGWWVAVVQLVPASSRPYIGGSQDNSVWNLMFGYNGFGRLTGDEPGSVGGRAVQGGGRWGQTGWLRLFNGEFGGQASWLVPAALVLVVAGLAFTWRAPRTNRLRAAVLLWGGWLVVTAATVSLGQGIIHPYYTVALAPALGATAGIGAAAFWARRHDPAARAVLATAVAATAVWSYVLLHRTPAWHPQLRSAVLVGGIAVALAVLGLPRSRRAIAAVVASAAVAVALAGPAAYSVATASVPHSGAIPSAGPAGAGRFGPGGGRAPGGAGGLLDGSTPASELVALLEQDGDRYTWVAAAVGSNTAAGYQLATGEPVMAIGGFNGTDPAPTLDQFRSFVAEGRVHWFVAGGGGFGGPGGGGGTTGTTAAQITSWVTASFRATSAGGVTLYDLTSPA